MKKCFWAVLILCSLLILGLTPSSALTESTFKLPASLKAIEEEAFVNLNTNTVELPTGLQRIENRAFAGSSLYSVSLPASLTYIADDAFQDAFIGYMYAPKGTYAYNWASQHGFLRQDTPANYFTYSAENGEVTITGYTGTDKVVVIPSAINGMDVRAIGENAFYSKSELTLVVIPNSVTSIGKDAFSFCRSLTNVTIPNSVTEIGYSAFAYSGLTSVTIPGSVTTIDAFVFENCSALKSLTLENGLTALSQCMFRYCTSLTSVTIPDSLKILNNGSFSGCTGLTSITIPGTLTLIDEYAFANCTGLKNVTIENGVKSIGYKTFSGCTGLTSITIPSSMWQIHDNAFSGCTGLTSVTILGGGYIDGHAFSGCTSLTRVMLPDNLGTLGGYAFSDCERLKSVTIPNKVTQIVSGAFQNCTDLVSITLPNSIKEIGEDVFSGCNSLIAKVYENSYAQTYCIDNNIPYQVITTEEDKAQANYRLTQGLNSAVAQYTNANGYVEPRNTEKAVAAALAYVQEQQRLGYVASYEYSDSYVYYIDNQYGLHWCYSPRMEGIQNGSGKVEIFIFEPMATEFSNTGASPVQSAQAIAGALPNYFYFSTAYRYRDAEVTLDTIRNAFGPNRIVLWLGHSGMDGKLLETGLHASDFVNIDIIDELTMGWQAKIISALHSMGYTAANAYTTLDVDVVFSPRDYSLYITKKFVADHCPRMQNSFIWLGVCSSTASDAIWKTFMDKGAAIVVGFSNYSSDRYDMDHLHRIVNLMLTVNPATNKHYTIQEAKDEVISGDLYDYDEYVYKKKGIKSYLQLKGNTNYRFWPSKITGQIMVKSNNNNEPIQGATVIIRMKNTNGDYTTIGSILTDKQGHFEMEVPNNSSFLCEVSHPDYSDESFSFNTLNSYEDVIEKKVVFYKITGQICASDNGQPIAGASVRVGDRTATADQNGQYEIKLNSEHITAVYSAAGFKEKTVTLDVVGGDGSSYSVALEPYPGSISGTVTSSTAPQEKLNGVQIKLYNSKGELAASTVTASGVYITGIPRGTYTLKATLTGYQNKEFSVTVSENQSVTKNFSMSKDKVVISGKITDKDTTEEIAGAVVQLKNGETSFSATTDAAGRYSIRADAGDYQITVSAKGYVSAEYTLSALQTCTANYSLKKVTEEMYTISGKVFKVFSDDFVSGATVELHSGQAYYYPNFKLSEMKVEKNSNYVETPLDSTTTSSDGSFTLHIPSDIKDVNGYYYFTILVRKTGWLTKYAGISCGSLDQENLNNQFISFAPEGSGLRVEGYHASRGVYDTLYARGDFYNGLSPYMTGSIFSDTVSGKFEYNVIRIYLNDVLIASASAPAHTAKCWHAFYLRNGILYKTNTASEKEYAPECMSNDNYVQHGMLYPSWMK